MFLERTGDSDSQLVRRTSLPRIKRLEELLRLGHRVLRDVFEKQLLVPAEPLLHVPIQRKLHILVSYQTRPHGYLQLTHDEKKAVESIGDESLRLRALAALDAQRCFDCLRNVRWEDAHSRPWGDSYVRPSSQSSIVIASQP